MIIEIIYSMLLLPLILIESYLLITLLLLAFGPITFMIESPLYFWFLISMYHLAFISGYMLYTLKFINKNKKNYYIKPSSSKFTNFILKYYWTYLFIAFIANILAYKNGMHNSSYIPYNFFSDFYNGLISPGEQRAAVYASPTFHVGNKLVTIILACIVIFKYSLISLIVVFWNKLSFSKKIISIFISLIPLISGVSSGTNKLIFDTLLIFGISLIIQKISTRSLVIKPKLSKSKKRLILVLMMGLLVFFMYYFNKSMSSRASNFTYMENTTISGNIIVPKPITGFDNFLQKVTVYTVQGYYGMSLALDEEFETTFGIGHSIFLLNQFKYFFGIDLIDRTYQYKINDDWHRLVQWHSFYSQFANDVSFPGVIFVMFGLGYLLATLYISAIKYNNIIAKLMMPIFTVMFIYMPANNQIFNFMETLFSFLILIFLWFMNRVSFNKNMLKKKRKYNE